MKQDTKLESESFSDFPMMFHLICYGFAFSMMGLAMTGAEFVQSILIIFVIVSILIGFLKFMASR